MKEVARTGGGRALEVEALRVTGATAGQVFRHNGTEFVPGSDVATLTTRGDLLTRNASGLVRLPVGAARTVLGTDGVDPFWGAVDAFVATAANDTTDDTWTTLATITAGGTHAVLEVHFSIVARKDDWSAGGAWRGMCAHRLYGGTYTAMGGVAWMPSFVEDAALEVRVTEDASGVHLQVKGPALGEYRWQVKYLRNVLGDE